MIRILSLSLSPESTSSRLVSSIYHFVHLLRRTRYGSTFQRFSKFPTTRRNTAISEHRTRLYHLGACFCSSVGKYTPFRFTDVHLSFASSYGAPRFSSTWSCAVYPPIPPSPLPISNSPMVSFLVTSIKSHRANRLVSLGCLPSTFVGLSSPTVRFSLSFVAVDRVGAWNGGGERASRILLQRAGTAPPPLPTPRIQWLVSSRNKSRRELKVPRRSRVFRTRKATLEIRSSRSALLSFQASFTETRSGNSVEEFFHVLLVSLVSITPRDNRISRDFSPL